MKWKVYESTFSGEFIRWNGSIIEANDVFDACRKHEKLTAIIGIKNSQGIVYDLVNNHDAVPEGWELPLSYKFHQKELF